MLPRLRLAGQRRRDQGDGEGNKEHERPERHVVEGPGVRLRRLAKAKLDVDVAMRGHGEERSAGERRFSVEPGTRVLELRGQAEQGRLVAMPRDELDGHGQAALGAPER